MKIAIISKSGTIMNWAEDAEQDFLLAGHEVRFISVRHAYLAPVLNDLLYSKSLGKIRLASILSTLRRFRPDIILAIGAYQLPPAVLEGIAAMQDRAPFAAWVGVKFTEAQARMSTCFDLVAYADTGLVRQHEEMRLVPPAMLVPLAGRAADEVPAVERTNRMLFVANPNPHRRDVLNAISSGVEIYGPNWSKTPLAARHCVHSRRISPERVRGLYRSHAMTLNMRSDAYNIDGLNQRHFSPYPYGCAVVAEAMKDLEVCFDLGREIFVWSTVAELDELYAALSRDPVRVTAVAAAGRKRVEGEHLYRHRIDAIVRRLR